MWNEQYNDGGGENITITITITAIVVKG